MTAVPPTLVHALCERATVDPDGPAFRTVAAGGAPDDEIWTWGRWAGEAARVAAALRRLGVEPGDRVAVLAGNVPLWPVADLAIQWAGAVAVGLYPTAAPAQIREILADAGVRGIFVDGDEELQRVVAAAEGLTGLEWVVFGTGTAAPAATGVEGLASFALADLPVGDVPEPPTDEGADALLIHTSGSTGVPRGARLSHRTLVASAESIRTTLGLVADDRMLSFLPFAHAAERVFGQATRIVVGIEGGLVPDPRRVFEAAAAFRPTIFGGLPRFYEKIHEAELAERGPDAPPPSPVVARLTGGAVRLATSGGAALPPHVGRALARLGLPVLGAYGLTEHLCVAFNRPDDPRFEDAGPAMDGAEIRIAADGEILVRRSDLTFSGYHGRPDETARAFTSDGAWLRTGDLGRLDEGRLTVTGRKKELLALSTGKKVAPLRIENRLAACSWIARAVLIGEGRKYVSALLTLRRPVVEAWARKEGVESPWDALVTHPRVVAEVERQIASVNARVSRTESVRRFDILADPLSVETGELTPTLKVRRDVVLERHAHRVTALYAEVAS